MSDAEIRIAIAEALGWMDIYRCGKSLKRNNEGSVHGKYFAGTQDKPSINYGREYQMIPDYPGDLNAMHEAEKAAFGSSNLWQKFVFELLEISGGSGLSELDGLCCLVQSTARQRAEAFLRTIGKWKDETP